MKRALSFAVGLAAGFVLAVLLFCVEREPERPAEFHPVRQWAT